MNENGLKIIGLIFLAYQVFIILFTWLADPYIKRKLILYNWCNSCWCRKKRFFWNNETVDCERDSKQECQQYIKIHFDVQYKKLFSCPEIKWSRCSFCKRPHVSYKQKCLSCGKINNNTYFEHKFIRALYQRTF